MKKLIFLSACFISSYMGFAQVQYSHYLDSSSEWRYAASPQAGEYLDSTEYFDGVQVINGLVYYKKYTLTHHYHPGLNETVLSGPIYWREDPNGKFYEITDITKPEKVFLDNQKILDAKIGDPFPGAAGSVPCDTIVSTETLYFDSTPLKKINAGPLQYSSQYGTVEGIGPIGLPCMPWGRDYGGLVCYTRKGVTIKFRSAYDCNSFPVPIRTNLSTTSNNITDHNFVVYPNPTKGVFRINLNSSNEIKRYRISNIYGSILKEQTLKSDDQEIDISDFANGVYVLTIEVENAVQYRKIIKE